ncbi:MAG: two-component regulator propeller domain-containing protein [Vicinamibacterales bacterium]
MPFVLALIAVAALAPPALAQPYRIDAWTADNGLPQNSVNSILQTRDSFIWLATFAGLVRYDGARFEVFNTGTTPQLRSSRFTSLFEDRDGYLWAGTEGQGLARHKDGSFQLYTVADGLPDNSADDLFYDADGRLLVDSASGIAAWTGTRFVPYAGNAPSISRNRVRNPFRMAGGAAWYIDPAGAHKYDGRRVTRHVPVDNDARWIFEDGKGRLWIEGETPGGRVLTLIENGVARQLSAADGVPRFRTMAVVEDRRGNLWFGLNGNGGLLRYAGGRFTRYTTTDGLPGNNVGTIFEDREGSIWVPTDGGLARLTDRIISTFATGDGLSADNVYPILEDRQGTVWIGGWPGLTQVRDGVIRSVGRQFGVEGKSVMSLFEDRDGALWIGLWGHDGMIRVAGGVADNFGGTLPAGEVIRAFAQDRAGGIWIGGASGLTRYSGGTFRRYGTAEGLAGTAVHSLLAGRDGRLWIGTDHGLSEYRDGVFTSHGEREGLSGHVVRSLHEDVGGVLWAGTYDAGLFRIAGGAVSRFTTREGLSDNGAFQVLEDGRGNFWISGNSGIYRVARSALNDVAAGRARAVVSVPYGKRDGMRTAECNGGGQPAGVRTRDGRLWFPTQKGVAVIDADHVRPNGVAPPVVITGVTVERQAVALGRPIAIQPGQSAFEISYAGLTFVQPELTRFRYKLEGLDSEWVEAGTRRTAYYSHVPFGSYRFVVTAANRDGVWHDAGAAVPVSVLPPFWLTGWFQAAAGLALIGLVGAGYRRRILSLQRTQAMRDTFSRQLVDSQEAERKRIAAELHDSVGQTLIVINNWALAGVNADPVDPEQTRARWREVSATAAAAINEVREITYNLGPHQLDRLGLADTILEMVDRVASASAVRFTTDLAEVDGRLPKTAEIGLYRIVQESMNNIVKHSRATEAAIAMHLEPAWLVLTISDNGIGFDTDAALAPGPRHQGFGLQGLTERARMLGGVCTLTSAPGAGTLVTVHLPYEDRHEPSADHPRG